MAIGVGSRVGPYEVTALIGEGGMGKVWRAHHAALKRDDALKVLPDAFASDPERLARFRREAQVLASLNHPNIAHVHGLEQADGVQALVMELVEGPTLADRIAQGPIPLDEALPVAKQIAEALEAAHEQGIIHRDLKPANMKLRPDGTVKVLDFGLAKAVEPMASRADATASPTITSPAMMTGVGVLLGTAAYMSPEQARGKTVDKRSDIWAFGCVLYEMLTGQRAFGGEDVTDTLAAVVRAEPEWDALPTGVSPSVRTFLRRCLQKNPKQRLHDIADMRLALEGGFETPAADARPSVGAAKSIWRRPLALVAATAIVAVLATGFVAWSLWPTVEPVTVSRFDYDLPEGQQFRNRFWPLMALSADGRTIGYSTQQGLALRRLDDLEARLIPGTGVNASNPVFSPDGQAVAYWQSGELKRVSISGGAPVVICAAMGAFGLSWETDNTILFGQAKGIMRVSANGGAPELVIEAKEGEQVHGPQLLPDGDSVLFSVTTGKGSTRWDEGQVVVQSLRTGERTVVLEGGSDARYVRSGHLVYALENRLFAVSFDADRLEVQGGPVAVVEGVLRATAPAINSAAANYGVSDRGTLVYVTDEAARASSSRRLVWVDRQGREEPLAAPPRSYLYPRLSPDGTRVAVSIEDQQDDIWVWDFARDTLTRVTFNPGADAYPVWTPDGRRLLFASTLDRQSGVFWQAADGTGSPERLTERSNVFPYSVSPDGSRAVLRDGNPPYNLAVLSLGAERTTQPLLHTEFHEVNAEISTDGRWLAYESDESGQREVYVRPFPDVDAGRWQVSSGGGTRPLWARNGQELFYLAIVGEDAALMSVRVARGATWTAGSPTKLFTGRFLYSETGRGEGRTYDVSVDGRRFLMVKDSSNDSLADSRSGRFVIVQNWTEELKRLVPSN